MPQTSSKRREKLYVIQQISWHYNDEQMIPGKINLLKAFRSKERAEAQRQVLEAQARAEPGQHFDSVTMFLFGDGGLTAVTSLNEEQMLAHFQRFGLEPPPRRGERYCWTAHNWWEIPERLDPDTLRRFLEVFDRRQYYQVVETEMEV